MGLGLTEEETFRVLQDPDFLDQLSQYEIVIDHTGTRLLYRCYRCDEDYYLPDLPGDFQDMNLAAFIETVTEHEFELHLSDKSDASPGYS